MPCCKRFAAGVGVRADRHPRILRRMSGDRLMNQHRDTFTDPADRAVRTKLPVTIGPGSSRKSTYDNAKLPHALILERPVDQQLAGDGNRSSDVALAGRRAACAGRAFSPDRFAKVFARGSATRPNSISSRWKHSRWCPPPSKRIGRPTIPIGSIRPGWHSSGSRAATTWGCRCAMPARGMLRRIARGSRESEPGGRIDLGLFAGTC